MRFLVVAVLASVSITSSVIAQAPDSLSFQGFLTDTLGNPIDSSGVGMTFTLYKDGVVVWTEPQTVDVSNGVFNVLLGEVTDLSTLAFDQPMDLGIKLDDEASEISPRTPLASAAFAKALPGLYTFYRGNLNYKGYNVVGGLESNVVGAGVTGTVIGGGGGFFQGNWGPNSVLGNFGTVSGGQGNTAGGEASTVSGGLLNMASGFMSTIGGGWTNEASEKFATIGGGVGHLATGEHSTIAGGFDNLASGDRSMIPGGVSNNAQGYASFAAGEGAKAIHGGTFVWSDTLGGSALFSTGPNQFLIGADGGVGINTNQPLSNSKLHVEHGSVSTDDWGIVLTNVIATNHRMGMRLSNSGFFEITNNADNSSPNFAQLNSTGNWGVVSDRRLKTNIEPASDLLQAALALEPVRYRFKNQGEQGERQLGMIAQDVQDVVPSLVTDGEPMTLNYAGLSVVAIGAIQRLYELVNEQQQMLNGLQAENERMRTLMERAGLQ
ncbi:MAG: tail fiber domain-containing protein [Rhodothermia bacterium]